MGGKLGGINQFHENHGKHKKVCIHIHTAIKHEIERGKHFRTRTFRKLLSGGEGQGMMISG